MLSLACKEAKNGFELAETWQHESVLRLLARKREHLVEDVRDLLLRQGRLLRKVPQSRGFRHHLRHRQPPLERVWVNARCINITARRARLPARVTELAGRDQATVRAEAGLRVIDPVERRFGIFAARPDR